MSGHATTWYVEIDTHGNKTISEHLPADAAQKLWCSDDRAHDLWECDWTLAERLWRDRKELEIQIKIWRRRGLGKIEPAPDFSALKKNAVRKRLTKARRT